MTQRMIRASWATQWTLSLRSPLGSTRLWELRIRRRYGRSVRLSRRHTRLGGSSPENAHKKRTPPPHTHTHTHTHTHSSRQWTLAPLACCKFSLFRGRRPNGRHLPQGHASDSASALTKTADAPGMSHDARVAFFWESIFIDQAGLPQRHTTQLNRRCQAGY
jgi:hypothetical protein